MLTTFACPVPWCAGVTEDHGGDGGDPSTWLHLSEHEPLTLAGADWATLARAREGCGPDVLNFAVNITTDVGAAGAHRLAVQLRDIAARLEAAAVTL